MKQERPDALSPALAALATRLKEIQQEAENAGLFLSDRSLLQCPACGLYEDVRFDGRLITCFAADKAGVDTGLRFERIPEGFLCPGCQHILDSPEEAEA